MNDPMVEVCIDIIFRNKIGIPTILGFRSPVSMKKTEMCYLYRRTRRVPVGR